MLDIGDRSTKYSLFLHVYHLNSDVNATEGKQTMLSQFVNIYINLLNTEKVILITLVILYSVFSDCHTLTIPYKHLCNITLQELIMKTRLVRSITQQHFSVRGDGWALTPPPLSTVVLSLWVHPSRISSLYPLFFRGGGATPHTTSHTPSCLIPTSHTT